MPRERRQRRAAEATSVSRHQEKLARREECVKCLAPGLSTRRAVKIQTCQKQARSRDCGIIKQRCQEFRHVKDKDFSEITQSTAVPARRSVAVPIGSPCLCRFFALSKLPSPGLPGLYLYRLLLGDWPPSSSIGNSHIPHGKLTTLLKTIIYS